MKLRSAFFLLVLSLVALVFAGCTGMRPASQSMTNTSPTTALAATAPTVLSVAAQANGVAPNREIAVTFSEAMDPATINSTTFFITGVDGAVSYDAASKIASLKPVAQLKPLTAYTATVTTGVANAAGQHMAQNYVFSFTTRADQDTSPPTVVDKSPMPGSTCVPVNTVVTYTFSEGLDPATINTSTFFIQGVQGTVTYDAVSFKATFTPAAPLQPNTLYSGKTTTGIADLAGVHIAGEVPFYFTTAAASGTCGSGAGGGNTYVYVGAGYLSPEDKIAGFLVGQNGSVTAVPGSPFSLAGGALAASPSGSFLFGEFIAGPKTGLAYYSYTVAADGSLSTNDSTTQMFPDPANPGSNFMPDALGWLTTDRTGATLYGFQYSGSGNRWIGDYAIGANGSLSPLNAIGGGDTPISFTPDDHYGYLVSLYRSNGTVSAYTRNPDGTLSFNTNWQPTSWAPPAGSPRFVTPQILEVSPVANYVAVVLQDTYSGTRQAGIAIYLINSDGTFGTPTAFIPVVPSSTTNSLWTLTWDSTGTYVFVSATGGIDVFRFDATTNTLAPVATAVGGVSPSAMKFLNGHLFAVNLNTQSLFIYNFTGGLLTPAPGSPVPLGFNPIGLAALQH